MVDVTPNEVPTKDLSHFAPSSDQRVLLRRVDVNGRFKHSTPILDVASEHEIPVSVCGEMASDPVLAVLLVGLGYYALSVSPPSLPLVKWVIRKVPVAASREAADEALAAVTAEEAAEIIRRHVRPYVDLALLDPSGALLGHRHPD